MVKYFPKDCIYKEMYLINKFENDIMENSLQNLRNDKTKTAQKITPENIVPLDDEKELIENSDKNTSHLQPEKQSQKSNENNTMNIPEVINTSIEQEHLNDISLSDNGNTPIQSVDTTPTPQSKKRKRVKEKKSSTPEIKKASRRISKRLKKDQLQKQKRQLMDEIFQNWKV